MTCGLRIALTGGMACGKSQALAFFAQKGFRTFSADACVHTLLNEDESVREALMERFGGAVFSAEGTVNRHFLAEQVFGDSAALQWLENCLHPRVKAALEHEIALSPLADWVVEIPLLFEKNLEKPFDFTVCVACLPITQTQRLTNKGLTRLEMEARLRLHLPLEEKMRLATCVFWNEGTIDWLSRQVDSWSDQLHHL